MSDRHDSGDLHGTAMVSAPGIDPDPDSSASEGPEDGSSTSRIEFLRGGRHWMALFGAWLLLNMVLEVFDVIEIHPVTVGFAGLILIGEAYYDTE